jgi:hypothetical protein
VRAVFSSVRWWKQNHTKFSTESASTSIRIPDKQKAIHAIEAVYAACGGRAFGFDWPVDLIHSQSKDYELTNDK